MKTDQIKVIPFVTMEGCVQISQDDPGQILACSGCTQKLCKITSENVRVLTGYILGSGDEKRAKWANLQKID